MLLFVHRALPATNAGDPISPPAVHGNASHLHERPEAEVYAILAERHPPIAHLQHVSI